MNKEQTQTEVLPSLQSKEGLAKLSKEFTPKDVKFLLALNSNFSREEVMENAKDMIERLQKFVNNNHSCEGLGLKSESYTYRIAE